MGKRAGSAPSFINSNSPSHCAQLCRLPQEARSPPCRLNRICSGHQDGNLRKSAEGRKFPKKNICVCERFQVRSHPLPDGLVSASRSYSWGRFWPSKAGPGVIFAKVAEKEGVCGLWAGLQGPRQGLGLTAVSVRYGSFLKGE